MPNVSRRKRSGVRAQGKALGGERDRNFALDSDAEPLLLKITNRAEPEGLIDLRCQGLRHLAHTAPALPIPRIRAHIGWR